MLAPDLFRPSLEQVLNNIASISKMASVDLSSSNKIRYSQYFTEGAVARQMANMLNVDEGAVIGDHGAGTGLLCATVMAYALSKQSNISQPLSVHAYEIDEQLHSAFGDSMAEIAFYAQGLLNSAPNVSLNGDFMEMATTIFSPEFEGFLDTAILNPPYQKLNQTTEFAQLMRKHLVATPNVYAAFIALSVMMLKPGGQLVAIVPRSFCNGTYFKAFRTWLKAAGSIDWFVRYRCRSNLFRSDNVLQENVTFRFTRGVPQLDRIRVSLCESPEHPPVYESMVPTRDILPADSDIIFVPGDQTELASLHKMRGLPFSAKEWGINFSTGKLEDFRVRELLHHEPLATSWAPVIYSQHWERGQNKLHWSPSIKGKPACVELTEKSKTKVIPRGNYVCIKRISANDDRSGRCHPVALLDNNPMPGDYWAIDNHIQVISGLDEQPLTREDAIALTEYLLSDHIDHTLRVVSGTTQLNINDLLQIRYPKLSR